MKKAVKRLQEDTESKARRALIEDLFQDFHSSRRQIFEMNFIRGIFFGVGSVIGGTLVVAILAWILSLFTDAPGILGEFIQFIVDTVQRAQ